MVTQQSITVTERGRGGGRADRRQAQQDQSRSNATVGSQHRGVDGKYLHSPRGLHWAMTEEDEMR